MRYRFADRVLELDADGAGAIALLKTFPRSEEYLDGAFHAADEVPPSLVLETMAQAGSLLLSARSRFRSLAVLLKINRALFPHAVRAGDRLVVRSRLLGVQGEWGAGGGAAEAGMARAAAQCSVGERAVAEADMLFLSVPMAWTLGTGKERILANGLDLLGLTNVWRSELPDGGTGSSGSDD